MHRAPHCSFASPSMPVSDAQAAGGIALDVAEHDGETMGYIQADVSRSKTSYTLERNVRYLAMVAPIYGLHPDSWALAYMKLLDEHGPERGSNKPLLPTRVADGWGLLPASPESGGKILRSILYKSGRDVSKVKLLGTHSLKATTLSWGAKFGPDRVTRAPLSYHASGRQGTELVYGRDNIAAPLRALERMILEVAMKGFMPDTTRSGYILPESLKRSMKSFQILRAKGPKMRISLITPRTRRLQMR